MNISFGKIAYGLAFMLVLPIALIFWARQTESVIHLPIPDSPGLAWALILAGTMGMAWAMGDLWFRGKGLPMNAYPPERLVTQGAYRYVSHPIYVAASLLCAGIALFFQSRSGFWLVSPILTLAWLSLVWGFENQDLKNRFHKMAKPFLSLPDNISQKATVSDRVAAYFLVFLPWVLAYESLIFIGLPTAPLSTFTSLDDFIPVSTWTEAAYAFCYPFAGVVPLILKEKKQVRSFMIAGWVVMLIGIFLQIILPFVAEPKPFLSQSFWGDLLTYERSKDGAAAAFPSFHAIWALLAAYYYTNRWRSAWWIWYAIAIFICASCLTTGMHSVLDVVAGAGVFFLAIYRKAIWIKIRSLFEKLANSWQSWQIGGLRIINHSIYAGASAFVGVLLVSVLLGDNSIVWMVGLASLAGAALWAQLVEGSAGLSRPFGYYGSIIGGLLGSYLASYVFQTSLWSIIGAFALASPWIQAIGRLRCVVQGCCHGRPSGSYVGIRIIHEKSRVCALSHLKNQFIHITPLYSILSNLVIGGFLWRFWYAQMPATFITGLYFILSGLSRFIEEAYRGEIQTVVWFKLKLYQWLALGSVWLGIACTVIPSQPITLTLHWHSSFLWTAGIFGLLTAFAMGMDFPYSQRRFSRLAG